MVNEAYLNRLNAELPGRSADGEMGKVDRLDPFRLRIDRQRADRERYAIGNSAFLGVQLEQPGLARERVGQRPLPELEQQQRQGAAEQRGIDQIVQKMAKAEPQRGRSRYLGVAAADPAKRKAGEGDREHGGAGADMGEDVVESHAAQDREHEEARRQRQRYPVRD